MSTYYLQPRYDRCKSFYGKAQVIEEDNTIKLQSYDTIVATITNVNGKDFVDVYGLYSRTTTRHIHEFLTQHGFNCQTTKEIMEKYGRGK
jgi:hypothetical protein